MWTVVSFQGPYHWCLVNWQSAVIISTWYGSFSLGDVIVSQYSATHPICMPSFPLSYMQMDCVDKVHVDTIQHAS